jgi:hypothetical protein
VERYYLGVERIGWRLSRSIEVSGQTITIETNEPEDTTITRH